MKTFSAVLVAAAALLSSCVASAATVYYAGMCGSFDESDFTSPADTGSGTWTCPTAASLDVVGTLSSEFLVYDSDYSSGLDATVTIVTNWTFSGAPFSFSTDSTVVTGGGSSNPATSTDGILLQPSVNFPPMILPGFYLTASGLGTPTVDWSTTPTAGTALSSTGYAEVVYVTGTVQPPSVPEPTSLLLFGSGLIALGVGRKLARKQ